MNKYELENQLELMFKQYMDGNHYFFKFRYGYGHENDDFIVIFAPTANSTISVCDQCGDEQKNEDGIVQRDDKYCAREFGDSIRVKGMFSANNPFVKFTRKKDRFSHNEDFVVGQEKYIFFGDHTCFKSIFRAYLHREVPNHFTGTRPIWNCGGFEIMIHEYENGESVFDYLKRT